jgi:cytochrome c-type biogenesis protein CcmI
VILFWVIGAALAAAALVLVLRPLLFKKKQPEVSRGAANVSIYRDQLRELDGDRASGVLAQADYERARSELEARLLEDVVEEPAPRRRGARSLTVALALAVPLCAAAVYIAVGNPGAIDSPAVQLQTMVERLAAHLGKNPDDSAGWKLLGQAEGAREQHRRDRQDHEHDDHQHRARLHARSFAWRRWLFFLYPCRPTDQSRCRLCHAGGAPRQKEPSAWLT